MADDPSVAGPLPSGPSAPGFATFAVRFQTDNYPIESQWSINLNGEVIWYASLSEVAADSEVVYSVELLLGESYLFVVYDSRGDGICKLHHSISINVMLVFVY